MVSTCVPPATSGVVGTRQSPLHCFNSAVEAVYETQGWMRQSAHLQAVLGGGDEAAGGGAGESQAAAAPARPPHPAAGSHGRRRVVCLINRCEASCAARSGSGRSPRSHSPGAAPECSTLRRHGSKRRRLAASDRRPEPVCAGQRGPAVACRRRCHRRRRLQVGLLPADQPVSEADSPTKHHQLLHCAMEASSWLARGCAALPTQPLLPPPPPAQRLGCRPAGAHAGGDAGLFRPSHGGQAAGQWAGVHSGPVERQVPTSEAPECAAAAQRCQRYQRTPKPLPKRCLLTGHAGPALLLRPLCRHGAARTTPWAMRRMS